MSRPSNRTLVTLVTVLSCVALGVGGLFLVARPGGSEEVLHRLPGSAVDAARQVGETLVVENDRGVLTLLDLESGDVREKIALATGRWYAGRGPVALAARGRGRGTAYGHDGALLWQTEESAGRTARPVAIFDDGATVLRDCPDESCTYRALEPDGTTRWQHPVGVERVVAAGWYVESLSADRPVLLPGMLVTHPEPGRDEGVADRDPHGDRVSRHDPETGQPTDIGTGYAVADDRVTVLLDTTDGACDLTIVRGAGEPRTDLPGLCAGTERPLVWLVGGNAVVSSDGQDPILVNTADGVRAQTAGGLLGLRATAAGLIGLDDSSWLFGTNGAGRMAHRADSSGLLRGTGQESIVLTYDRQPWNPFARGSVRHLVRDAVTGETCGSFEASGDWDAIPLPGCRAVLFDPGAGESVVVGRR